MKQDITNKQKLSYRLYGENLKLVFYGGRNMKITVYSNTLLTYKTETNFYLVNKYKYKNTITYILLDRVMMTDDDYYDEEIARSESEIEIAEILKDLIKQ